MHEEKNPQIAVELTGVSKFFGGREVLRIDAFRFERGVRYALLGANGSGKSTLLRILAGHLKIDQGEVRHAEPYASHDIAYLPQNPYAFALPVEKSVLIGAENGKPRNRKLALEALDRVGMRAYANARENRLSGGEAQRVALARVMIQKRKLLLLDEPTSATDLEGIELLESALEDFFETTKCTMMIATHSPAQAIRLADQAIILDGGRIIEHGDVKTVIHSPSTERARAFLRNWKV